MRTLLPLCGKSNFCQSFAAAAANCDVDCISNCVCSVEMNHSFVRLCVIFERTFSLHCLSAQLFVYGALQSLHSSRKFEVQASEQRMHVRSPFFLVDRSPSYSNTLHFGFGCRCLSVFLFLFLSRSRELNE